MCRSLLQLTNILQCHLDGDHLSSLDSHIIGQPGFHLDVSRWRERPNIYQLIPTSWWVFWRIHVDLYVLAVSILSRDQPGCLVPHSCWPPAWVIDRLPSGRDSEPWSFDVCHVEVFEEPDDFHSQRYLVVAETAAVSRSVIAKDTHHHSWWCACVHVAFTLTVNLICCCSRGVEGTRKGRVSLCWIEEPDQWFLSPTLQIWLYASLGRYGTAFAWCCDAHTTSAIIMLQYETILLF